MLQLKMTATRVRMGIIEATHGGKSGHPGGSLSAADVLTYLYFKEVALGYTAEMAVNEAKRCLQCKKPACRTGCPVQIRCV